MSNVTTSDGSTVRWIDLNGFERDILRVLLTLDQPSGQDIRRAFMARHDEDINHGRLYPNLDKLVDLGLVQKGQQNLRTNYYEVSSDGRRLILGVAREFDRATNQVATDGGEIDE